MWSPIEVHGVLCEPSSCATHSIFRIEALHCRSSRQGVHLYLFWKSSCTLMVPYSGCHLSMLCMPDWLCIVQGSPVPSGPWTSKENKMVTSSQCDFTRTICMSSSLACKKVVACLTKNVTACHSFHIHNTHFILTSGHATNQRRIYSWIYYLLISMQRRFI